MFFGMPLLNVLTDDGKNYFTSLFNFGHFTSILFAAFFFGLIMQLVVWLRIRKAKEDQDDYQEESYEIITNFNSQSYFGQYLYDLFPSLWLYYTSFSDHLPASPSCLEQRTKVSENHIKKIRLLNASLCFILVSLPQLITNSMDWRYLLFLTICIIFSLVYFYTLYQLFKEVKQKECY